MTADPSTAPLLLLADGPDAATTLSFVAHFHPGTTLVLADAVGVAASDATGQLTVDRHAFAAGTPRKEMLRSVLTSLSEPVVLLCEPGDLPLMPILERAAAVLMADETAVAAVTAAAALRAPCGAEITATLEFGRALPQQRADLRMQVFASWPFATRRGAVRREHLLSVLSAADTVPQLAAFAEGLEDAARGRIGLVPEIGFLRVPREVPAPLDAFAASPEIVALTENVATTLAAHGTEDTDRLAEAMVRWGIAEAIGVTPPHQRGFDTARHALSGMVDRQFEAFEALLKEAPPQLAFAAEEARAAKCPAPPVPATTARRVRYASRRLDPATLAMASTAPPLDILVLGDGALGDKVWPLLAARLVDAGLAGAVAVVHHAAAGATVADWAPGGTQFGKLEAALDSVAPPMPQFVIWHQGMERTASAAAYREAFVGLFDMVSTHLPDAIWLICRTPTEGVAAGAKNPAIEAQEAIIEEMPRCVAGAPAHVLAGRFRTGNGALSAEGAGAVADMLADAIALVVG